MSDPVLADILLTLKQLSADFAEMKRQNAELRQMLADKIPTHQGWLRTTQAAEALRPDGVRSVHQLRDFIEAGVFLESKGEIRNIGKGDRSVWELYIPKAKSALHRYFKELNQRHWA